MTTRPFLPWALLRLVTFVLLVAWVIQTDTTNWLILPLAVLYFNVTVTVRR